MGGPRRLEQIQISPSGPPYIYIYDYNDYNDYNIMVMIIMIINDMSMIMIMIMINDHDCDNVYDIIMIMKITLYQYSLQFFYHK